MRDILLDKEGDIWLDAAGDIALTESPAQEAKIRLKWFLEEWVYGPGLGMPWYGEFLIKNPSLEYMRKRMVKELKQVDHVLDVPELKIITGNKERKAVVTFVIKTTEGLYKEEVQLFGK